MIITRTMRGKYNYHYPQFIGKAADIKTSAVSCSGFTLQIPKLNKPRGL